MLLSGEQNEKVLFLDGPGGQGKTLLLKIISALARSQDKVVWCVVSSGIAAQNLTGCTTAHSLFRLSIHISDDGFWSITNGTQRAELIRAATLLIFDEAAMAHKKLIEMLDRSLRDLMQKDELFGGKIIIFSGDFRHILPVVENARSTSDIVRASVRVSYIWKKVKSFTLTMAHRLTGEVYYEEILMKIGSGSAEYREIGEGRKLEKLVPLPQISDVTKLRDLIDSVFAKEILQKPDECAKGVVICTLNNNVKEINRIVMQALDGESF